MTARDLLFIIIGMVILGVIKHIINSSKERIDFKNTLAKVHPCGHTIPELKKILEETTHCGKYWGCKAKYDPDKNRVYIYMEGNEHVSIDLTTGKRTRIDLDY